jgi:hypothetical protein
VSLPTLIAEPELPAAVPEEVWPGDVPSSAPVAVVPVVPVAVVPVAVVPDEVLELGVAVVLELGAELVVVLVVAVVTLDGAGAVTATGFVVCVVGPRNTLGAGAGDVVVPDVVVVVVPLAVVAAWAASGTSASAIAAASGAVKAGRISFSWSDAMSIRSGVRAIVCPAHRPVGASLSRQIP